MAFPCSWQSNSHHRHELFELLWLLVGLTKQTAPLREITIVINGIRGQGPRSIDLRINLLLTPDGILGFNRAVHFRKKYSTARCGTPHQNYARIPANNKPQRRLDPDQFKQMMVKFKMIEQGVIRPSKSLWTSTLARHPQKRRRRTICGDYRALNAHNISDRYLPPHIEGFAQQLLNKCIFSNINLVHAYQIIIVAPQGVEKQRSRRCSVCSMQFMPCSDFEMWHTHIEGSSMKSYAV